MTLFFSTERDVLRIKDTTRHMFELIQFEMLWLMCIMIHVALKNYEHNFKKIVTFQNVQNILVTLWSQLIY